MKSEKIEAKHSCFHQINLNVTLKPFYL